MKPAAFTPIVSLLPWPLPGRDGPIAPGAIGHVAATDAEVLAGADLVIELPAPPPQVAVSVDALVLPNGGAQPLGAYLDEHALGAPRVQQIAKAARISPRRDWVETLAAGDPPVIEFGAEITSHLFGAGLHHWPAGRHEARRVYQPGEVMSVPDHAERVLRHLSGASDPRAAEWLEYAVRTLQPLRPRLAKQILERIARLHCQAICLGIGEALRTGSWHLTGVRDDDVTATVRPIPSHWLSRAGVLYKADANGHEMLSWSRGEHHWQCWESLTLISKPAPALRQAA